jgi:hypothetical protein
LNSQALGTPISPAYSAALYTLMYEYDSDNPSDISTLTICRPSHRDVWCAEPPSFSLGPLGRVDQEIQVGCRDLVVLQIVEDRHSPSGRN